MHSVKTDNITSKQQQLGAVSADLCQLVEEQVTSSGVSQPPGNNAQALLSMTSGHALVPDGRHTCTAGSRLS